MADSNRPKRIHKDPYGGYLDNLTNEMDALLRVEGVTPDAQPEPGSYEPDETEVALCRAALELIGRRFGPAHLRAAIIAAGIESGDVIDDDLDFSMYLDALEYVKVTFGKDAEKAILAEIQKKS